MPGSECQRIGQGTSLAFNPTMHKDGDHRGSSWHGSNGEIRNNKRVFLPFDICDFIVVNEHLMNE